MVWEAAVEREVAMRLVGDEPSTCSWQVLSKKGPMN